MQQAPAGYSEAKKLRALKVYSARVFEICSESGSIADLDTSYWQLRVEPVPADDLAIMERCAQEGACARLQGCVECISCCEACLAGISCDQCARICLANACSVIAMHGR